MKRHTHALAITFGAAAAACTGGGASSDPATGSDALVTDARSIVADGHGTFTVTCNDGRVEIGVSADAIRADAICRPAPASAGADDFTVDSLAGADLTASAVGGAASSLQAGGAKIGAFRSVARTRTCTSGACGAWSDVSELGVVSPNVPLDGKVSRPLAVSLFSGEVQAEIVNGLPTLKLVRAEDSATSPLSIRLGFQKFYRHPLNEYTQPPRSDDSDLEGSLWQRRAYGETYTDDTQIDELECVPGSANTWDDQDGRCAIFGAHPNATRVKTTSDVRFTVEGFAIVYDGVRPALDAHDHSTSETQLAVRGTFTAPLREE